MQDENNPWKQRFDRERKSRKESEALLEQKSLDLWHINQDLEKKVQERTHSLESALLKAEKADRAKSDFLANISHEVRTPLNAIIGFAKLLTESKQIFGEDLKHASIIHSSAESLLGIINDILDFSKMQSGNFDVSIDESDIITECQHVVELFTHKTKEKNIELEYLLDRRVPRYIMTDVLRLRQVLSNLLSNAIKFTPEYGRVSLIVRALEFDEERVHLGFEIKDTGIGIPEDRIDSVLTPFVQLEHAANQQNVGTGLGLSICLHILKLLDSTLKVTSEVGQGSTFSFDIWANMLEYVEHEIEEELDESVVLSGKILVAEDNPANQQLMKLVLQQMNLQSHIVANGQEALEAYMQYPHYDFVLMDINMPVMNGIDALKAIRAYEEEKSMKNIPIIALTANAIKGDKERFLEMGMDDYLSKPIQMDRLKKVAHKYIGMRTKNEPSTTSSNSESELFDVAVIATNIGVNEEIALMLIDSFKLTIGADIKELEGYITAQNEEQIIQKAHYIKNSCLNLFISDACDILQQLENKNLSQENKEKYFNELIVIFKDII